VTDADRYHLLFGPYPAPRFRCGDAVITGLSNGPIPWPVGKRPGRGVRGGGAIDTLGTATVQECTLSGNTAGSAGGGLFNDASGTLTVQDSTVCGNVAPLGADLFNLGVATLNDSTVCVIYS